MYEIIVYQFFTKENTFVYFIDCTSMYPKLKIICILCHTPEANLTSQRREKYNFSNVRVTGYM